MLHPDADLSRKERGHRGVRPRHPETGNPSGRPEEGSSSGSVRVYFVVLPARYGGRNPERLGDPAPRRYDVR